MTTFAGYFLRVTEAPVFPGKPTQQIMPLKKPVAAPVSLAVSTL